MGWQLSRRLPDLGLSNLPVVTRPEVSSSGKCFSRPLSSPDGPMRMLFDAGLPRKTYPTQNLKVNSVANIPIRSRLAIVQVRSKAVFRPREASAMNVAGAASI